MQVGGVRIFNFRSGCMAACAFALLVTSAGSSCGSSREAGPVSSPGISAPSSTPFTVPASTPTATGTPAVGTPADGSRSGAATAEDAVRRVLDAWRDGHPERAEPYLADDPEEGRGWILPLPAGHGVQLVTDSCEAQPPSDQTRCRIAQPDNAANAGEALVAGDPAHGYRVIRIYLIDYD